MAMCVAVVYDDLRSEWIEHSIIGASVCLCDVGVDAVEVSTKL